ncbi:MAG: NAD(P)-dependent oxidoreductase [Melioribacteraceae bacterium]|nr:NAD(P)-dependent oxidoreductase [Melioribacteraceae bacterium]
MNKNMVKIVITGASGFVGRYVIDNLKEEYILYAVARRSRKEADIPYHQNLNWIQCDVAKTDCLNEVAGYLKSEGGADLVIHLAAYYDFTNQYNPEYDRTNVGGTKNVLEFARTIGASRFIFASSLAACEFPKKGESINEDSLPDSECEYARSKRKGELLVREYSKYFQCVVVRLAAVYSDWCEYAPLYKSLSKWLSNDMDSRILAGRGEWAVPYIHVHDVCSFIRNIIRGENLAGFNIYNCSFDGSTSHKELFAISTRYYFGEAVNPFCLPKIILYPGLFLKYLMKYLHISCELPFEKFWMMEYIDRKLEVDSSRTRQELNWEPAPRYHIKRRLLFLLEKRKSHPDVWKIKNEAALKKVTRRINLLIYEELLKQKESVLNKISERILDENKNNFFSLYKKLDREDFLCYMSTLYHLIMASVRSGDRSLMLKYIDDIAIRRFAEGFEPDILIGTLNVYKEIIFEHLILNEELLKLKREIYNYIGLSLQIAQDEIEDLYEELIRKMSLEKLTESSLLPDCAELRKMIRQLSAFYQISPDNEKLNDN